MAFFTFYRLAMLAIVCVLVFHQGLCLQFAITPSKGTESLTSEVTLTCEATVDPLSRIPQETVLIQITKGDNQSVAMIRGDGVIHYGQEVTRKVEASGQVDQGHSKTGHLRVTLHFPSNRDTGIYKCHVVYLDGVGVTRLDSQEAYLDIDGLTKSDTERRLKALEFLLHGLNTKVQQLNATTHHMMEDSVQYFSASISHRNYNMQDKMTVVFDKVVAQEGQGYDHNTGTFTAPADGLYAFFLALSMAGKDLSAGLSLQTGQGRELARLYLEGKQLGDQSSVSTVATLKAGDTVKVKVVYLTKSSGYFYHNQYSMFSGFLINAE